MLRRIITLISVGLVAGVYADQDKLDQIQKSLDNIMAKAGISFGGEFRSQYFASTISGDHLDSISNANSLRKSESNEFTSVDFDIKARPNNYVSARVMFRMHQNWQNFFSDISNPIFSRWISIDGTPLDMFRFNVGDFKEKYSPLTLYSPDIDILYEPYVFAQQRQVAMDEMFIGDNYRNLQGVNLGFDAEVAPVFNEFHLGIIGSRLKNTETNIQNGSKIADWFEKSDVMSKYFVGSNLDLTFLKGISLGGTYLFMFDHKGSYRGSDTAADTLAKQTDIISLRPGIDISKTFNMPEFLQLKLNTEFAFTSVDSTSFDSVGLTTVIDPVTKLPKQIADKKFSDTAIIGTAINIGATVGLTPSKIFGIILHGSAISNDQNFRNVLAQTPSFVGERIMNIENDIDGSISHYSTFDALYHTVFKFCPSNSSNLYAKSPFMKNSYYRGIMDENVLNSFLKSGYDPSVQLIMPLGPATPNRVGFNADLKLMLLNDGIEGTGLISLLNEKTAELDSVGKEFSKTDFTQFGGGLKIDLSKMISVFKYPFEFSGSYVLSSASNDANPVKNEITSGFTNLGLRYQFWKKTSLVGGFQLINNKATHDTVEIAQDMSHWVAGLEWKVSDGASLEATVGQIIIDTDENHKWEDGVGALSKDFKQLLVNVFMRVKF